MRTDLMSDIATALRDIKQVLGPRGWIDDPQDMAPYLAEARGRFVGVALLVARPETTAEVAAVMAICHRHRIPVVPQGGNTGLVGGSIPYEAGNELVLSLGRLKRIRAIDTTDDTMTVEAGCILADLQRAAAEIDRLFPLSLGAEGSCQIGGNLATNAGGTMTIAYGNARELVLGLEVVLADGRIWNGLRRLHKDNTGYDLKHLFIGSEGTLGVITAAVVRMFPRPRQVETILAAIPDPTAAITLLPRLRAATGDALTGYELMARIALDFAYAHLPDLIDPLSEPAPWYLLIEAGSGPGDGLRPAMENALAAAFDDGLVQDAAFAESEAQRAQLWRLREAIVEAQKFEGGSIKNDISVPISVIPEFLERAIAAVTDAIPGCRPVPFGHVGDGNIHFNISQPVGAERTAYLARWDEVTHRIHDIIVSLEGSISAEHGVGRFKREELSRFKSPVELDLMRRIKTAFDPEGLLNQGKLIPEP
ncbi:MAG: FAD-binding oxidoreductase [Azospirillaceae bacterium]|nr:FAD-binding oxidoreductase [Azospirillaceae bacterium]